MKSDTTPSNENSDPMPPMISMPRLDDDAVIQIHDFIHQLLDLFEARYGDQIRRFYADLGGQDMLTGFDSVDDPPF